ncbi:MAG: hypothetical protein CMJ75_08870 [Planctomycetaceae bacterium]|nr:hypothetical protein [Planctomycetaceae bacterium]
MSVSVQNTQPNTTFCLAQSMFMRLLGVIHLLAFSSLWYQLPVLIGSNGILPVATDTTLHLLCGLGLLTALLLTAGVVPRPCAILLWMLYLRLSLIATPFLDFQWDTLLLESTFFSIFWLPWRNRPSDLATVASGPFRWGLWFLLFKLMFLSGATKLLSGDPNWRDLVALSYHYQTQPLPNWISWYMHHLPSWCHTAGGIVTLLIELLVPCWIFSGRSLRHIASLSTLSLMLLIQLTGNYGFFNLLTAALCLPLLDDHFLRFLLRRKNQLSSPAVRVKSTWQIFADRLILIGLLGISSLTLTEELVRTCRMSQQTPSARDNPVWITNGLNFCETNLLAPLRTPLLTHIRSSRTINGYGLFRVMTTRREELVIEGSVNGRDWFAYEFNWKPGATERPPRILGPYLPRLDWLMWFAALDANGNRDWLISLARHLTHDTPAASALLEPQLNLKTPPRYIRFVYYHYEFTRPGEASRAWWRRQRISQSSVFSRAMLDREYAANRQSNVNQ